jgi:hypothetical protein
VLCRQHEPGTLYFRLSLIWLAIVVAGVVYVLLQQGRLSWWPLSASIGRASPHQPCHCRKLNPASKRRRIG